jgi:hypothetical protein
MIAAVASPALPWNALGTNEVRTGRGELVGGGRRPGPGDQAAPGGVGDGHLSGLGAVLLDGGHAASSVWVSSRRIGSPISPLIQSVLLATNAMWEKTLNAWSISSGVSLSG